MANTQVQLGQKLQLTIKRLGINNDAIRSEAFIEPFW